MELSDYTDRMSGRRDADGKSEISQARELFVVGETIAFCLKKKYKFSRLKAIGLYGASLYL